MKKCMYCEKELEKDYVANGVGYFCTEEHFDKYLASLSDAEYVKLQHSFCVCNQE